MKENRFSAYLRENDIFWADLGPYRHPLLTFFKFRRLGV